MANPTTFQRRLRAELDARKMPPGRADRLARLAQGTTKRYLNGTQPTVRSLEALAEALGVPPGKLLQEKEEAPEKRAKRTRH